MNHGCFGEIKNHRYNYRFSFFVSILIQKKKSKGNTLIWKVCPNFWPALYIHTSSMVHKHIHTYTQTCTQLIKCLSQGHKDTTTI